MSNSSDTLNCCYFYESHFMIPESKVITHDVLAHEWVYGLMTRPNMRIKVGRMRHDIRILGRIVGVRSTEQSVWYLLAPISYYSFYRQFISLYILSFLFKNVKFILYSQNARSFWASYKHLFRMCKLWIMWITQCITPFFHDFPPF